jgi:hypothetical protein
MYGMLAQPTRYQQGPELIAQRWDNLVMETGIAALLAACYGAVVGVGLRLKSTVRIVPFMLLALYLLDVGRVDSKFLLLVDPPKEVSKSYSTPVIEYLSKQPKEYRVLPLDGGPGPYSSKNIPVMFIPMPVQQKRWQDILDTFNIAGAVPDMLNVKFLVAGVEQYQQEKAQYGPKYVPVFTSPDNKEVVLENRNVLPKAWLVPAVAQILDQQQRLAMLQSTRFDPRAVAIVESPPPITMADPNSGATFPSGGVSVTTYEGERVAISANVPQNAMLVLGERYYKGWKAAVDGTPTKIYPVDHILRGIYLPPGNHTITFVFDPLPSKIGKWLTLSSFAIFALMLAREAWIRNKVKDEG